MALFSQASFGPFSFFSSYFFGDTWNKPMSLWPLDVRYGWVAFLRYTYLTVTPSVPPLISSHPPRRLPSTQQRPPCSRPPMYATNKRSTPFKSLQSERKPYRDQDASPTHPTPCRPTSSRVAERLAKTPVHASRRLWDKPPADTTRRYF